MKTPVLIILIADAFVVLAILVLSLVIWSVMPELEYPSVNAGVFPLHCPNYRNYSKVTFYPPVVPDPPTPAPPGVEVDGASSSSSSNESSSNVTGVPGFNYTLLQPETGLIKSVGPATWIWVHTGFVGAILCIFSPAAGMTLVDSGAEGFMMVLGGLASIVYLFRLCWVIVGTYLYSNLCEGEVSPQFADNLFMATIALGWIEILAAICTIVVPCLVETSSTGDQVSAASDHRLQTAAAEGALGTVKTLVEVHHLDIHAKGGREMTALHFAARNGHLPVVEYLLEHGADIHAKDKEGDTALHCAAQKGECMWAVPVIECLMKRGANPNDKNNEGKTPLETIPPAATTTEAIKKVLLGTQVVASSDEQPLPKEDVYQGEYKDGKMHGQGTITYANGAVYEGEWKEDKKHGQGTFTFANGDVYQGEWKEDKKHGQGTFTYANGDVYQGEYKEDNRDGPGTFTRTDF